jgi:hypothetical protein
MHSQTRTTAVYQFAIDNSQLLANNRGEIQHRTLFHVPFCGVSLRSESASGLYPTDYYQITINAETAKLAETIFHSRLILRALRVLCVQRRDRY